MAKHQRWVLEGKVKTFFRFCPFCLSENSMDFEWGTTIPNHMVCRHCRARWYLLFDWRGSYENTMFLAAKLENTNVNGEGSHIVGKMYRPKFWQKWKSNQCPRCGALNSLGYNFCGKCGAPLGDDKTRIYQ